MTFFRRYKARLNLLLLAILLWLFVKTGREFEALVEVPIEVVNIVPGKLLVSEIPPYALVRFQGPGRSLFALKTYEKAAVELDLSSINYFYDYPLRTSNVKASPNLKVEALEILYPDTVKIVLEKLSEGRLEVVPRVELRLEAGFVQVGEIEVNPPKVMVSAPASIIQELEKIYTVPVVREGLKQNFQERIALETPNPQVKLQVREVSVEAHIERLTEMRFRALPIRVENPPAGYRVNLEPETISIMVSGAVSIIKNLAPENISAVVKFDSLWSGDVTPVVPQIILPEGVELLEMEPDTVVMTLAE